MESSKGLAQEFHGSVGQVAGGNIINIQYSPKKPAPEVIRAVAELLNLAKANNLLNTIQNISQIIYGSTHFKGLTESQLKNLLSITQEIIAAMPAPKSPWWKFWR